MVTSLEHCTILQATVLACLVPCHIASLSDISNTNTRLNTESVLQSVLSASFSGGVWSSLPLIEIKSAGRRDREEINAHICALICSFHVISTLSEACLLGLQESILVCLRSKFISPCHIAMMSVSSFWIMLSCNRGHHIPFSRLYR